MKSLGIVGGSSVLISVSNGKLIMIKAEDGEAETKIPAPKTQLKV